MDEVNNAPMPRERLHFEKRDWLALGMALGLSLLWFSVFGLKFLLDSECLPSLGAATFTWAIWAAVLIYLGHDAIWTPWNTGLAIGVALLTVCLVLYADAGVKLINYLLIAAGSALCFFSLSGAARRALSEARVVGETAALTFMSLFSNWFKPFRAVGALSEGGRRTLGQVFIGLAIAVPVLILVLSQLVSADAVFGSMFGEALKWLLGLDLSVAWRIFRTLIATMMLFSALYFLRHLPKREEAGEEKAPAPAAGFVTVLSLLIMVYVLFVGIQLRYLFGGAETAAMDGGYAQYARSGFFQLVRVSAINLVVVLCCGYSERKTIINIMSTILLALTAVILFSAFWRMRLYILAYGLSLLRAMTLWAMAFIAVCLALAALRIWRPGFKFWPFFAAIGLAGWLMFNFVNIDARIADYNVNAYLDGRLESVDIYYLSTLSPDVVPALERLKEAEGGDYKGAGDSDFYLKCDLDDAIHNARRRYHSPNRWSEWTISWARYNISIK